MERFIKFSELLPHVWRERTRRVIYSTALAHDATRAIKQGLLIGNQ